jgi:hypothetical protein
MPDYDCRNRPHRRYKVWRYPGVPIPTRLKGTYSIDGRNPWKSK